MTINSFESAQAAIKEKRLNTTEINNLMRKETSVLNEKERQKLLHWWREYRKGRTPEQIERKKELERIEKEKEEAERQKRHEAYLRRKQEELEKIESLRIQCETILQYIEDTKVIRYSQFRTIYNNGTGEQHKRLDNMILSDIDYDIIDDVDEDDYSDDALTEFIKALLNRYGFGYMSDMLDRVIDFYRWET